jgi:methyl-accepting chemotaxis protein
MLNRFRMAIKLPALIICTVAMATIVSGVILAINAGASLKKSSIERLLAVEKSRKSEFSRYLKSIETDLVEIAKGDVVKVALQDFSNAWKELENPRADLTRVYVTDNPHPTGSKENLDAATDGSTYSQIQASPRKKSTH